jgi:hypothetical protein
MHIRELNDELMRTYRSRDFNTDDLDSCTSTTSAPALAGST